MHDFLRKEVPDSNHLEQSASSIPTPERRMAETPVPIILNQKRQGKGTSKNFLRKSRYGGLLIYLLTSADPDIREQMTKDRKQWMLDFVGRLSIENLLKAYSFASEIRHSTRVRNSLKKEIIRELQSHRSPGIVRVPDPRRIGVGYRDKGALRPLHQKRNVGADALWWDDVKHLLPSMSPPENGWITAEEVQSFGINSETVLNVLLQISVMKSFETLSDF